MTGFRTHLVNVWTVAEGSAPPYTMVDSLLYLPEGAAPDVPRPGVVVVPGWSRYPYDTLTRALAPALAATGVAVLALGLRRRGGEGQTVSPMPDSDARDIRVGLDALAQHGVHSAVLVGQDVGATSVARYAADAGDQRVAGIALVDPIPDLNAWLVDQVGTDRFEQLTRLARQTTYEMKSDLIRIDLDVALPGRPPLWIHQATAPFLAWWSANPGLQLPYILKRVGRPVLTVAAEPVALPGARTVDRADLAPAVAEWASQLLPRPANPTDFELVQTATSDATPLVGYLVVPREDVRRDAAILVVHGLTTGPFSPMVKQFLPHYADHGFASLAIETRRSGLRCIADSFPENDNDDIAAFIALLRERGYDRVILVGASLGSQAVSRYIARRHDPAVIAAIHLAPTGDMGPDAERNTGADYGRIVEDARRAVAEGRGDTDLVVYDLTERGPSRFHAYRRTFWRAASWLAWWGPEAATRHTELIGDVDVPTLLVSGTADDYNDQARMDELVACAAQAPYIDQVWVGADHGLRGAEGAVTARAVRWLEEHGLVTRRQPPPPRPLAPITAPSGATHVYPPPPD